MTDLERRDVQYLLDALKRAEWSGEGQSCPVCRRLKRYGATHVCSCPIAISLVKVKHRLLGAEPLPEPKPSSFDTNLDVHAIAERYEEEINWGAHTMVSGIAAAIEDALAWERTDKRAKEGD